MSRHALTRFEDWETRLINAIEETPPFAWGRSDCCRFAARIVRAMTGTDPMADYDCLYATAEEADTLISRRGGLAAMIAAELGVPLWTPNIANRGDIILARTGELLTVGICVGDKIAAQGPDGVVYLPRRAAVAAWKV